MDLFDTHATAPMVFPDVVAPTPNGFWTPMPPPQVLSGTRDAAIGRCALSFTLFPDPCELLSFSSPCPLPCADLYAACYEIAVVVHVRSTGDAPILKQSKFKV